MPADHFAIARELFEEIEAQFNAWYKQIGDLAHCRYRGHLIMRIQQRERRFIERQRCFQALSATHAHQMRRCLPKAAKEEAKSHWVWAYQEWHFTRQLCSSDIESTARLISSKAQ